MITLNLAQINSTDWRVIMIIGLFHHIPALCEPYTQEALTSRQEGKPLSNNLKSDNDYWSVPPHTTHHTNFYGTSRWLMKVKFGVKPNLTLTKRFMQKWSKRPQNKSIHQHFFRKYLFVIKLYQIKLKMTYKNSIF